MNMYIMHQINICFVIFFLVLQQQQNYNWQWMVVTWMEVSPPISGVPVPEVKVLKMTISYKVTYCTQIFDLLIFTNLSYLDRSQGRLHLYRNWDRQGPGWYIQETSQCIDNIWSFKHAATPQFFFSQHIHILYRSHLLPYLLHQRVHRLVPTLLSLDNSPPLWILVKR